MEQIQETIEDNNARVEQKFADLVEGLTHNNARVEQEFADLVEHV
jgi:hypothetical protein